MIKVVLDTNLVISAALSREGNPAKIFEMLLLGYMKNYTTQEIINEIKEVMERPKITKHLNKQDRFFMLTHFENNSEKIKSTTHIKVVDKDPADDKFINCALTAKADYIISGDNHLLKLKTYENMRIINPATFLQIIKDCT